MSTTIKVSVEYEIPKTTKFEALMKEYEMAKKIADKTVDYYKPLADCAEKAKFEAIMEQLEIIKQYAKQISNITHQATFLEQWFGPVKFELIYRPKELTFEFEIKYGGKPFVRDNPYLYRGSDTLMGNWDKWRCFERLEQEAYNKLKELIKKEKQRGQEQIDRLNNILK